MHLLPRLDGAAATKRELVMLRYLSFTQTVMNHIPTDSCTSIGGGEVVEDELVDDLTHELIAPFREDYEEKVYATSSLVPLAPGRHRHITRKTLRNSVAISDMAVQESIINLKDGRRKVGKCSKVKLRRQKLRPHLPVISEMYLSLENVIKSINPVSGAAGGSRPDLIEVNVGTTDMEKEGAQYKNDGVDSHTQEIECVVDLDSVSTAPDINSGCNDTEPCTDNPVASNDLPADHVGQVIREEEGPLEDSEDAAIEDSTVGQLENSISLGEVAATLKEEGQVDHEKCILCEEISLCSTEVMANNTNIVNAMVNDDELSEFEALRSEESESQIETFNAMASGPNASVNDEESTKKLGPKRIDFAAAERSATFDGPASYSGLCVANYVELYFRSYVFPSTLHNESLDLYQDSIEETKVPRVQLYQTDRDLMMWTISHNRERPGLTLHLHNDSTEQLVTVSKQCILPCGVAATGRIQPKTSDVRGFKGNKLFNSDVPFSMSESQELLFCISNKAMYIMPDFASIPLERRRFPSPIPSDTTFADALWPHAYIRHPLKLLKKISFDGYGFQRLTLFFKLPALRGEVYVQPENGLMSAFDYTYVIFTCNQRRTIQLLQSLQEAAKEASPNDSTKGSTILVENDNNGTIQAVSRALDRANFTDDILHYQILHQSWHNVDCKDARRSFVLTNDEVFLFNETYAGDVSACALDEDTFSVRYGDISMRTISSVSIEDITDISIAKEDPKLVTIVIKSQKSRLRWSISWSLKCQDHENAERLVDDVRKACRRLLEDLL